MIYVFHRDILERAKETKNMKNFKEIRELIKQHKPELEKRLEVKEIGIFGSYARNKPRKTSDVDILVEFAETVGLFEFIELEEYLQKLIGTKVDLVSHKALKPRIGKHILNEVVYV